MISAGYVTSAYCSQLSAEVFCPRCLHIGVLPTSIATILTRVHLRSPLSNSYEPGLHFTIANSCPGSSSTRYQYHLDGRSTWLLNAPTAIFCNTRSPASSSSATLCNSAIIAVLQHSQSCTLQLCNSQQLCSTCSFAASTILGFTRQSSP